MYAAKELYNRDWRYHKELKLWFTRDAGKDSQVQVPPGGYICFDVNAWYAHIQIFQIIILQGFFFNLQGTPVVHKRTSRIGFHG